MSAGTRDVPDTTAWGREPRCRESPSLWKRPTYFMHVVASQMSGGYFFLLLRKRRWGWEPCEPGSAQLGFKRWCRHHMNMRKTPVRVKPSFGMAGWKTNCAGDDQHRLLENNLYFYSIFRCRKIWGEMSGLRIRCRKIRRCQNKSWGLGQLVLEGMLSLAHALPGPLLTALPPIGRQQGHRGAALSLPTHPAQQLQVPWQESF